MYKKVAILALACLMAGVLPGVPQSVLASSHREAPGIMNSPAADNTDVYFYVSPANPNNVVLVGCWWPMEEPAGGPNWFHFDPQLDYVFNIDNNGDSREDVSYMFHFTTHVRNSNTFLYATGAINSLDDPDWNYYQTYSIQRRTAGQAAVTIADNLIVPPANIGPRTTPNYESLAAGAVETFQGQTGPIKTFAGQRDDPFFVDLGGVFDLVAIRSIPGNAGAGVDGLGGYDCQAIVMELPISDLTRNGSNPTDPAAAEAILGCWSITRRGGGPGTSPLQAAPISRLGMPLVNEVVIPLGKKDTWNKSWPKDDGQFLSYVTNPELAQAVQALYGITAPPAPRCDLVAIFLTGIPGLNQPPNVVPGEMIRLNVAIKPDDVPNHRLGLLGGDSDGFPNGRRLTDDVVDIAERAMEGVVYPLLCNPNFVPHELAGQLGDGVDVNDRPFLEMFPYLATPWEGYEHDHHRVEPPHPPEAARPVGLLKSKIEWPTGDRPVSRVATFGLKGSSPNPVRVGTNIGFELAAETHALLQVFDVSGRTVKTLVDGQLAAGPHTAQWDGTDENGARAAAGVYFYRLEAASDRAEKKLVVLQ